MLWGLVLQLSTRRCAVGTHEGLPLWLLRLLLLLQCFAPLRQSDLPDADGAVHTCTGEAAHSVCVSVGNIYGSFSALLLMQ